MWCATSALILAGLLGSVASQSDPDRDRFYSRIRCHTCDADFSNKRYQIDHPCLIGDRGRQVDTNRDVAMCSRNARYCKAEVSRQLGMLVTFQRSCAEECAHSCTTKGFGIVRETCIYCCTSDASCSENPEKRRDNYARPNRTIGASRRTSANDSPQSSAAPGARSTLGWILPPGDVDEAYTSMTMALLAAIGSRALR